MCQLGAMIGGWLHIHYLLLLQSGEMIQAKEITSCSKQTLNRKS